MPGVTLRINSPSWREKRVLGPDFFSCWQPSGGGLLAYGPLPGVELFGYFLGLVVWVGLAVAALLRAPLMAIFRRFRRNKGTPPAEQASTTAPESAVEVRR